MSNPPPVSSDSAPAAPPEHILPQARLTALCNSWLLEDTPFFDPASAALPPTRITATLYAKSSFLLAGSPFVETVFRLCGCDVSWLKSDADAIAASGVDKVPIAVVTGPAPGLLRAERPALNALAECCGIASAARRAVLVKETTDWGGVLAATRKTLPGLRLLQKYGVIIGGMDPHRMDLSSMAMLKDNHIAAAGSVAHAVKSARRVLGFAGKVEVEVGSCEMALEACRAGADVVMLDNFGSVEAVRTTADVVKEQFPGVLIEVSGGVEIDSLRPLLIDGVDIVSFSVFKFRETVDVSLTV